MAKMPYFALLENWQVKLCTFTDRVEHFFVSKKLCVENIYPSVSKNVQLVPTISVRRAKIGENAIFCTCGEFAG